MYKPAAPYVVYCSRCWWSDKWDVFEYGRDYDFSRPFFEQSGELWQKTPLLGISIDIPTMETSPYTNHAGHLKNCYLLFHADYVEDSAYGFYVFKGKNLFDCSNLILCELSYDLMHAYKTARSVGARDLLESVDCFFLKDSENCQDCFASANLRGKNTIFSINPTPKTITSGKSPNGTWARIKPTRKSKNQPKNIGKNFRRGRYTRNSSSIQRVTAYTIPKTARNVLRLPAPRIANI